MLPDEFLGIFIRSSVAIKKLIILTNQAGIVDCDYYSNEQNDGNIGICLLNTDSLFTSKIKKGEKIVKIILTGAIFIMALKLLGFINI